jgi:hypothetical protein
VEVTVVGLMDKMKEQAATASAVAKDAAQKGQAKLDGIQAKRVADGLLHDLGAAVYSQQPGHGTPSSQEDIDRLIAALKDHEEANGPIDLSQKG